MPDFLNFLPTDPLTLATIASIAGILFGLVLGYAASAVFSARDTSTEVKKAVAKETERATASERERMHKVYNEISNLTATLNYQRILENSLTLSSTLLGSPAAPENDLASGVLLFSHDSGETAHLCIGSARRFTPSDMRASLLGASGLLGKTIDSGEAVLSKDISKDPELTRIVGLRTCVSGYCIPLRAGLNTYGVLLFAHPQSDFFNADRRETLKLIAYQAVIAIENARLYSDLEQEKEKMLQVQEETRKKLARDLHDGPTQSIAAIAMRVNFARRLMERDVRATTEELVKVEDMARRTTKEIRHMLFTLRPLVLESQGLIAALETTADKMRETYNQNVVIQAHPAVVEELEMGKQAVIFYIAEEAVNNARKHAQAAHIYVRLKGLEKDIVLLEIEDDGVGFNVGAVDSTYDKRGSLGMVNMRERAELVNGVLQVDSAEGRGTRIRVAIPLTEDASDRLRRG